MVKTIQYTCKLCLSKKLKTIFFDRQQARKHIVEQHYETYNVRNADIEGTAKKRGIMHFVERVEFEQ